MSNRLLHYFSGRPSWQVKPCNMTWPEDNVTYHLLHGWHEAKTNVCHRISRDTWLSTQVTQANERGNHQYLSHKVEVLIIDKDFGHSNLLASHLVKCSLYFSGLEIPGFWFFRGRGYSDMWGYRRLHKRWRTRCALTLM